MSTPDVPRTTAGYLSAVPQDLQLTCVQCRHTAVYDVGTILCAPKGEGGPGPYPFAFTNYFRCRNCGGPGPWEIADGLKMSLRALTALAGREVKGMALGQFRMHDGTVVQTPAMGEERLRGLIAQDPTNAFLHTRLGSLLRNCGQQAASVEWFEQALRLDPGDLEARDALFGFAFAEGDLPGALLHGPLLVEHLLAGRRLSNPQFTEELAYALLEDLRRAPEPFRERFLGPTGAALTQPADRFIRGLLQEQGDEETILTAAVERLLSGQAFPVPGSQSTLAAPDPEDPPLEICSSLGQALAAAGLGREGLTVPLLCDDQGHLRLENRSPVPVFDGQKTALWPVSSLRALFRGDRRAPPDMDHYPPEYTFHFYFIEQHVLTLCRTQGDRTDQEMEQLYSALRRRPDGRRLSREHDFLWQVAALLLGQFPLSEAEFVGLFSQLERSTRKWALRPVSRHYAEYLHETFDRVENAGEGPGPLAGF